MPGDLTTEALVEELYKRSQQWTTLDGRRGVTRPVPFTGDSLGSAYGRAVMGLSILVVHKGDNFYCMVLFHGIDDGDWSLVGPDEDEEKASRRASTAQTLCGPSAMRTVPSHAEATELANRLGLYLNL